MGGCVYVWSAQDGFNVNCRNKRGTTPLHLAAEAGNTSTVQALVRAGADVNAANRNGDTPLILASLNGHRLIVDALLKAGADVHAVDQFGSRALFYASRQGHCGRAGAHVPSAHPTASFWRSQSAASR